MSKQRPTGGGRPRKKVEVSLVRSSAAEYLTFVAARGQGGVEAVYADENVWLSQKMMGLLYAVETHTVNYHIKNVFDDGELETDSVVRNFRITAADGKTYDTQHYNLSAIVAVGYNLNSERAVQFRKWATGIMESFNLKGCLMDNERLKKTGSIFGKNDFEQQLESIREIRLIQSRQSGSMLAFPSAQSAGRPRFPLFHFSTFPLFHFSTFPLFHFSTFPLFHFSTFCQRWPSCNLAQADLASHSARA